MTMTAKTQARGLGRARLRLAGTADARRDRRAAAARRAPKTAIGAAFGLAWIFAGALVAPAVLAPSGALAQAGGAAAAQVQALEEEVRRLNGRNLHLGNMCRASSKNLPLISVRCRA